MNIINIIKKKKKRTIHIICFNGFKTKTEPFIMGSLKLIYVCKLASHLHADLSNMSYCEMMDLVVT